MKRVEIINNYQEFKKYKSKISSELQKKGFYSVDILLLYYEVSDVIDLLLSESETFQILKDMNPNMTDIFFKYFIAEKKAYRNLTLLQDRETLDMLVNKSKLSSDDIYQKENISFIDNSNKEKYLKEIVLRLKLCINLYYSAYKDKKVNVELSNGELIYFEFLERNLAHILGVPTYDMLSETRSILDIKWNEKPINILYKIIKDIEGNQDLISSQFSLDTKYELLPFDKIDLKTRAFLLDSPYERVSTIVPLAKGEKLAAKNNQTVSVKISKSELVRGETAPLNKSNALFSNNHDYTLVGYGVSDAARFPKQRTPNSLIVATKDNLEIIKKKFAGQTPHNIVSITSPISGNTTLFTPEEEFNLFLSLYEDFGGSDGMNLRHLLEELRRYAYSYEKRVSEEIDKRNNLNNGRGRII